MPGVHTEAGGAEDDVDVSGSEDVDELLAQPAVTTKRSAPARTAHVRCVFIREG
jgi:hypothetical protein